MVLFFSIVLLNCSLLNPQIVSNSNPFPDLRLPLHPKLLMGSEHWCIRIPSPLFLSKTTHYHEITHFPNPPLVLWFCPGVYENNLYSFHFYCIFGVGSSTNMYCVAKHVFPQKFCTTRFFQPWYRHNISEWALLVKFLSVAMIHASLLEIGRKKKAFHCQPTQVTYTTCSCRAFPSSSTLPAVFASGLSSVVFCHIKSTQQQ